MVPTLQVYMQGCRPNKRVQSESLGGGGRGGGGGCGGSSGGARRSYKIVDFEDLRSMVFSLRVSELQVLLGFAGRNKSGCKHDLLMRALHLLKSGCSLAVQIKIRELYRCRNPRTFEGLF